ncbi:MAG: ribonuclease J [Bacilli bacterium]|nr:ribonuclease J [Bacilli bacterium]
MNYNTNKRKKTKPSEDIRVFSLGGLGVVGMNMYVVECDDEIIVMDAGVLFADDSTPGANYIIPDFTYLQENEDRIVGLFITHGHEDHIGGLPFLLQKVKIPVIYASGIAISLINNKMSEFPNISYNLQSFNNTTELNYKNFKVSFFRTNHSIPDSYGIAIKTKLGYIVNTGDFKFDFTPVGAPSDYFRMAHLGEEGVLCLMADSTNSDVNSFSSSEKKIATSIKQLISNIDGRIIIATFASNVYRVQQIIEACASLNRKIAIFGHSMDKSIEAAIKAKYICVPRETFIGPKELDKYPPEQVTILCTGSQGEPLAALSRIANGTHKQIKLLPTDTVIYSSKPIPGNEQFINRNINMLVKSGANIIKNSPLSDTHTTGHASVDEIKLMFSLMRPKYFMPVHGEYNMLKQHANIAVEMGVKKENCFCLDCGDVLVFKERGNPKVIKNGVFASDVYLDSNLSDIDSNILKERKHLADEGLLTVIVTVNKQKQIVCKPVIASYGFIDVVKSTKLVEKLTNVSTTILEDVLNKYKIVNVPAIKNQLVTRLNQYIEDEIEHRPFIVPIVKVI